MRNFAEMKEQELQSSWLVSNGLTYENFNSWLQFNVSQLTLYCFDHHLQTCYVNENLSFSDSVRTSRNQPKDFTHRTENSF